MTFCCENTKKAYELMGKSKEELNWRSEGFSFGDIVGGVLTLNTSTGIKVSNYLTKALNQMIDAHNILCDARNAMNACNCGNQRDFWKNEESKEQTRANNNARDYNKLVGEWNEQKKKHDDLVEKFIKNVGDYNRLVGEHNGMEERFNDLQQRHNRLERDNRELREKYENERSSLQQRVLQLTRDETRVREEGVGLRNQLIEVKNEREVLLIRVEEKNTETLALTKQMGDLRIEFDRTNIWLENQLDNTQKSLEKAQEERDERIAPLELQELLNGSFQKDEEISSLKERLGQSRESDLTEKIRNKEQRLQSSAHRLGIDWEQIQILRDIFNELVHYQNNGDINGVRESRVAIETVKQSLLQNRSSFDDVQEICDKCEEVARLDLQLEQQFEARIEVAVNQ